MKSNKSSYTTARALAAAIRAYRANGRINREFVREDGKECQPNRLIITNAVNQNQFTDQELTEAHDMTTYLKETVIMQTLKKGSADQFLKNIVEMLSLESVTAREFGLLAWAPKLAADYQRKDQSRQISSLYENRSGHFGQIGERVEIEFTLIESAYIKTYDCYRVYGYTDSGNLVSYWAKDTKKIVEQGRIRGRINKHVQDSYRANACVTIINYVKVLD